MRKTKFCKNRLFTTHGYPLFYKKRLFATLFSLIILLPLLTFQASAATPEEIFEGFFETLPNLVQEELGEAAKDPTAVGELVGAEYLLSLVLDALGSSLTEMGGFFLKLAGALILFSALTAFFGEAQAGVRRTLEIAMSVALACFLYREVASDMSRAEGAMQDMCHLANSLLPAFGGLFLAGGNVGTATAASSGIGAFILMLENLAVGLFLPLLRVLFGFVLIGAVGGGQKTEGIFRTLRHFYVTVLVFLSLLLTASLGFQTSLAASADSLSVRSVKFALGQMIPVIGGSLAETLRILTASLSLLKNSIGALSVVSLLLMILPTLLTALLHRLGFSLAAAFSHMLGCAPAEKLFTDFRGIYDLAIATLSITLVLFLLILTLLAHCGSALTL